MLCGHENVYPSQKFVPYYLILYGLITRKIRWLSGFTSIAIIIFGELVVLCIISFPIALS